MASPDRSIADNEEHRSPSPAPANDAAELSDNLDEMYKSGGIEDDLDDDLFGDGGDDDQPAPLPQLDDEDLDSGDDLGQTARVPDTQHHRHESEGPGNLETFSFMDTDIARHAVPEPSDGELYLLKVPRFLEFEPTAFNPKSFRVPVTDHHSKTAPSEHFSAFDTAMTTIRWRRSPNNPKQLQSNARILRWSDGSLTLQLASQPLDQYEMNANALAPPQINPKKPTPTSVLRKPAQMPKESYTYLASPYEEAGVSRVTNKVTTSLFIVPTSSSKDTALDELQSALAKAANRQMDSRAQAISFVDIEEDPELARARKEAEYKQRLKQQRAKEKNEQKAREKESRVRGHRTGGFGLSAGMLEGDERDRRGGARKPRTKVGGGYASEDDGYGRGRTKEDEYDEEDDFIAASDEEEDVDDDDDPDDGIRESPRRARGSPKRQRLHVPSESPEPGEDFIMSRIKRRRVIDDDDDDE